MSSDRASGDRLLPVRLEMVARGLCWGVALAVAACGASWTGGPDLTADGSLQVDSHEVRREPFDLVAEAEPAADMVDTELPRTEDPTALLEDGWYWLANGEPAIAAASFNQALAVAPDLEEAILGAGLSEYVRAVEFLAMVLTIPSQLGAYGAGDGNSPLPPAPGKPESENDYLVEQLHRIFLFLHEGFVLAEGHLSRLQDPGFQWTLEAMPIFVFTKPVLNLHGSLDLADIQLIRSSNAFFLWFTGLLAAQDFHTDLLSGVYAALRMREGKLEVLALLNIVAKLMASDSRFLSLHESDGEALFLAGQQQAFDAGALLLEGLYGQSPVLAGEEHAIAVDWLPEGARLQVRHRKVFPTGEEVPLEIEYSQSLLDGCDELLQAMTTPGQTVSWALGPALQLGIVLGHAARMDLLRFLPVKMPIDLSGLQPAQVAALLTMFLGNSLGFDFAALAGRPTGLRPFLPLLVKTAAPQGPQDYWMEWECPEELSAGGTPAGSAGILCSGETPMVDAPHFVGTALEIAADGVASPLPYMVWEDPTWGGFLMVDQSYAATQGNPADFVVPDLFGINLGVRQWLGPILGLL